MRYIPPFSSIQRWTTCCSDDGYDAIVSVTYDDLLDVIGALLQAIPVDEGWYISEYPGVTNFIKHNPGNSAASHFRKHGYFEGRRPFAAGWRDFVDPVPFAELKQFFPIMPIRGHLHIRIERANFISLLKAILKSVPTDEGWYRTAYPAAAKAIDNGKFANASHHYVEAGYFEGQLPFEIVVDADWYVARYEHVRTGIERGIASSPQEHFLREGYREGCRPVPQ
jgi:hypothetical protein